MAVTTSGSRFSVQLKGNPRALLDRFQKQAVQSYNAKIAEFAIMLNAKLVERTPVWEGDTLRNWRWSVGAPDLGAEKPGEGSGPPGHTNSMAIGAEPRRGANVAAELSEFEQFLAQLRLEQHPVSIFLTNVASSAQGVEAGLLPTPERSRTKRGVLYISLLETMTALDAR